MRSPILDEGGVKGTVGDYSEQKHRPGHHLWTVDYADGFREDYDHEDMNRWGISQVDGSTPSGGGMYEVMNKARRA